MLRLDPGEGRAHTARQFTAWEGGGEYNVARGLRRCFGLKTGVVTAFADNPVGRLVDEIAVEITHYCGICIDRTKRLPRSLCQQHLANVMDSTTDCYYTGYVA